MKLRFRQGCVAKATVDVCFDLLFDWVFGLRNEPIGYHHKLLKMSAFSAKGRTLLGIYQLLEQTYCIAITITIFENLKMIVQTNFAAIFITLVTKVA